MGHKRLLWQLLPSYLLIALAAIVIVGWFASQALEDWYVGQVRSQLVANAHQLDRQIGEQFSPGETEQLQKLSEQIAQLTGSRVTLILPDGQVLCETQHDPGSMENHADRPEVREALAGRIGEADRFSSTVDERMKYVALPIKRDGRIVGVVRLAMPVSAIDEVLHALQWKVTTGGMLVVLLAVGMCYLVARRISRPLDEMHQGAERLARGELGYKFPVSETEELAGLAEALNEMARQLEERLNTVVRQSNEQQAVLASMVEGVLAVDSDQRVISLNKTASQLIGTQPGDVLGRNLQEVVRNADLRRFATRALLSHEPIVDDLVLRGETERVLHIHGAALRDAQGKAIGAVIVMNDVTSFRRLENIRRDFVANVSHELKTPIASIKGFVETLLEGAMDNPQDAERFLQIIAKQADRLNAIIEDLLSLSKIEQSEQAANLHLEDGSLRQVLEDVLHDCEAHAAERNIQVRLACPDNLRARINPPLLEQAVNNLLDNAIKYSEPGEEVVVEAHTADGEVLITVSDHGVGIEPEHLPRIFERFYRVDKARSRKLGGTGLGLAIVKHIVQAHRGRVTVQSTPGEGSQFVIHLPRY